MDLTGYLQFVAALAAVLALILLLAWAARRSGLAGKLGAVRGGRLPRRLALIEAMPLDARRRLVLLRCDRREHLVLLGTGQGADLLLESRSIEEAEPRT